VAERRDTRRRAFPRARLVVVSLAAALLFAEGAARLLDLDEVALRRVVVFQGADLPVYREGPDAFLRYETTPGSSGDFVGGDATPRSYHVRINRLGARGPEITADKPAGTRRILCVGGSTMYGAGVAENETLAARIAYHLRTAWPDAARVEALNFGRNGYNLAQAARLAHDLLPDLDPDLVVVQDYNRASRMFHGELLRSGGIAPYFDRDPEALLENGLSWDAAEGPLLAHGFAMRVSALYRFVVATLRVPLGPLHVMLGAPREIERLEAAANARGAPVFYLRIPALGPDASACPEAVDLYATVQQPDDALVHPPAPILDRWAAEAARSIAGSAIFADAGRGKALKWGGCIARAVAGRGKGANCDGCAAPLGAVHFLPPPGGSRVYRADTAERFADATRDVASAAGWSLEDVSVDVATASLRFCASERRCTTFDLSDADAACEGRVAGEHCIVESGETADADLRERLVAALAAVDASWVRLVADVAIERADPGPGYLSSVFDGSSWPISWIRGLAVLRLLAVIALGIAALEGLALFVALR
jgi:hypothetical protein